MNMPAALRNRDRSTLRNREADMSPRPRPLEARFWEKVDKSGGAEACWHWTASYFPSSARTLPYGRFVLYRLKSVLAHRVAFELSNGPIPPGLQVCHTCDNSKCCNPAHLVLGSHAQNMLDRKERGRTACGERAGRAKLTEAQVVDIRRSTESYRALRERYGIADGTIHAIKIRRIWAHVG